MSHTHTHTHTQTHLYYIYIRSLSRSSDAGPRPLIVIQSNSRVCRSGDIKFYLATHGRVYNNIYHIISYHIVYMRFDDDWWTTAAHHPPVDFSSQPTVILYKRVRAQQHTHSPAAPLVSTTLVRRCASYIIYNISFAARAFDSAVDRLYILFHHTVVVVVPQCSLQYIPMVVDGVVEVTSENQIPPQRTVYTLYIPMIV